MCDEETGQPVPPPEFAFCAFGKPFKLSLEGALESECEDMYEDAYTDLNGVKELQAAVDVFNEANKGVISYEVDYNRKVRLRAAESR